MAACSPQEMAKCPSKLSCGTPRPARWRHIFSGHGARVFGIAFDATGRRLATTDANGVLFIWEVDTGRILRRESVGAAMFRAVVFAEDGRHVVTGTHSGLIVYDLEGNAPPRVIPVPQGVRHFVVDRTRNDVVIAGVDGALTRVSLSTLAAGERLDNAHDRAIEAIAISRDGRMLATGGLTDGQIILRDAQNFGLLFALPPRTGIVKTLKFDATGQWLAMAGAAADITLWDLKLVHDELAAIGLAWDQPAPRSSRRRIERKSLSASGQKFRPYGPVTRAPAKSRRPRASFSRASRPSAKADWSLPLKTFSGQASDCGSSGARTPAIYHWPASTAAVSHFWRPRFETRSEHGKLWHRQERGSRWSNR